MCYTLVVSQIIISSLIRVLTYRLFRWRFLCFFLFNFSSGSTIKEEIYFLRLSSFHYHVFFFGGFVWLSVLFSIKYLMKRSHFSEFPFRNLNSYPIEFLYYWLFSGKKSPFHFESLKSYIKFEKDFDTKFSKRKIYLIIRIQKLKISSYCLCLRFDFLVNFHRKKWNILYRTGDGRHTKTLLIFFILSNFTSEKRLGEVIVPNAKNIFSFGPFFFHRWKYSLPISAIVSFAARKSSIISPTFSAFLSTFLFANGLCFSIFCVVFHAHAGSILTYHTCAIFPLLFMRVSYESAARRSNTLRTYYFMCTLWAVLNSLFHRFRIFEIGNACSRLIMYAKISDMRIWAPAL